MGFQQKINAFDFVIELSYSSSLMLFCASTVYVSEALGLIRKQTVQEL